MMQVHVFAQIDQKKLDSLAKSIDSSTKAYKTWQDSFSKKQDSIYHSSLKNDLAQNQQSFEQVLAEQNKMENKQRQQAYIRISIGVLFFMVLIFGLLRKRKPRV